MDIYFISPHLDDAILSAGGLIYDLKNKENVKIITVFTKGGRSFLERKREDKDVCHYLGVDYLHLDFIEKHYQEKVITSKLKKIIDKEKNALIFAPLAIGDHIDHRIVNKICRENFTNVIYWEDYPYNLTNKLLPEFIKKNNFSCFEYKKNLFIKEKLIKFYHSQIPSIFGDKPIIIKKERYYYKQ